MYNQPFLISRYPTIPNLMRGTMLSNATNQVARASLFGRIGNFFHNFKAFNWSGLINNTSKTLGIINQTIPLVRQVGPMVGNMRSMIKLASVFKDETDTDIKKQEDIKNNNNIKEESSINNNLNYDSPTFFIN